MEQFPAIPEDLLKALAERFPDRCPEMSATDREVWASVGAQQVVRFLKRTFEEQNESILASVHYP